MWNAELLIDLPDLQSAEHDSQRASDLNGAD
jgi:hypothetical protein